MIPIKSFGLKRNLDYLKESSKLTLKSLLEYKQNFYFAALVQISFYFIIIIFYSVLYLNFKSVIDWEFNDFILFITLTNLLHLIYGSVFWKMTLFEAIKNGDLNNFLFYPINKFFSFNVRTFYQSLILYYICNFSVFIFSIFIFNINISNKIYFFSIVFLIIIETIFFCTFIDSLNFIKLGSSEILKPIHESFQLATRNYPSKLLSNFNPNFILLLFQGYFVGIVLIPISKGMSISNFKFELSILIISTIIFIFGTFYNWKYGLQKYEAFG